jgi:hypothetical protein
VQCICGPWLSECCSDQVLRDSESELWLSLSQADFDFRCLNLMQEASSYRIQARQACCYEVAIGHINEAIAILPDSPRLLIIRAFFQLIRKNVTAGVRSSHTHLPSKPMPAAHSP